MRILPGTQRGVGDARLVEQLHRACAGGPAVGPAVEQQHLGDLAADPPHRVERCRQILREEADRTAAQRAQLALG